MLLQLLLTRVLKVLGLLGLGLWARQRLLGLGVGLRLGVRARQGLSRRPEVLVVVVLLVLVCMCEVLYLVLLLPSILIVVRRTVHEVGLGDGRGVGRRMGAGDHGVGSL